MADSLNRQIDLIGCAPGDDYHSAFHGKSLRDRQPDTLRTAHHQGHLVRHPIHLRLSVMMKSGG